MKFLHLADCHLDAPFVELGQAQNKSNLRRNELLKTFSKVMEIAKSKVVDIVLISGDLFEQKYVDKSTIKSINNIFIQMPNIKIFISPGNHDPFIHNSYYNTFNWAQNVFIFKGVFEKVYLPHLNANVWGVGFNDFYINKCLVKDIDEAEKDKVNILITHGTLDICAGDERYHPLALSYISSIGFDYCALGHIHKRTIDEKNNIYYPGSPEPLGFDEPGQHGVIFGQVNKGFKNINFIPTATREYISLDIDISGISVLEDIVKEIKREINQEKSMVNLYKINLVGKVDDCIVDTTLIEESLKEYFHFLKIEDSTEISYPLEEMEKEYTLRGIFVKKMNKLMEKASQEDKEKLKKALNYGLDALTKGEIKL